MCHIMPTFYLKILIYWCKTDCCLSRSKEEDTAVGATEVSKSHDAI
ncbi:hypothetical protein T03_10080 [Trichinella britovi]|uniref:Uncharacterized protein n=1 Tax=Trichinella britovi TaxID=45882 RepID=A0A0V1AX63_TRIBR|nr:hypothetical protein T03_10080 [Trichinella britovi]